MSVLVNNVFTDLGADVSTAHNTPVTTELANIVSVSGAPVDPAAVTEQVAPAHGTLSIDSATGAVTYTPAPGYSGMDSYEVSVCDTSTPDPQCSTATVNVTVEANTVDAVDDAASTDAPVAVTTDVRANDVSASGQEFAAPTIVTDGAHGAAVVNGDGTVTYTPAAQFSGTDSYSYQVCDTSTPEPVCDTATVTVSVANVFTDGPAASVGVETPHNTPVTVPVSEIVSTSGAPVDPAAVTQVTAPVNGSISIDAATYSPAPGYAGDDSFTVQVCDLSTPAAQCDQVTVSPNQVAAPDLVVETRAETPAEPLDVVAASTSASGQPLAAPTVTVEPEHGTVTVNPDGTVSYVPADGYDGADSFVYQVCDTSYPTPVCDTGTVSVTVTPVADLAVVKTVETDEVIAGLPVSFDVATTNDGPSAAADVHTVDPVPAAIIDPVGTPDPGFADATCETREATQVDLDRLDPAYGPYTLESHPLVVECVYPELPSGTTVHDTIEGTVDPALVAGSELVNQAVVFSATYDPAFGNDLAVASVETAAQADLSVTKTAESTQVTRGDTVEFTVTVVNDGPSVATGVVVTDTPTGLSLVSGDASQGSFTGGTWQVGTLAVGDEVTLTASYQVTASDARNDVEVVSDVTDPDDSDNTDAVVLGVSEPPATGGLAATGGRLDLMLLFLVLSLLLAGAGAVLVSRGARSQR